MATNYGKQFELKFKNDWLASLPGSFLYRLCDQMTGYKITSQNPCDFICFNKDTLYLIEVKVIQKENTFDLKRLTQYDKLLEAVGIRGVRAGVLLWWVEKQRVAYVPVKTIEKLKADGKKSVNIKYLDTDEYRIIEIPSKIKRVFMDSDYSILTTLEEGD